MKNKILILFIIFTTVISCNNDDDNQPNIEGEYSGIFERDLSTSNVELNFDQNSFNGTSETENFPAICSGGYTISENTIEFEQACFLPGDIDITLILNGAWDYTNSNNTLTVTKSN